MSEEHVPKHGTRPTDSFDHFVAGGGADFELTISPEPTADERDAIVAALAILMTTRTDHDHEVAVPGPTPWQLTAREEAIRSGAGGDENARRRTGNMAKRGSDARPASESRGV